MQWTVKLSVQKQRCNFPLCSHSSSKMAWCDGAAFDSGSSKIRVLSFSLGRKHQLGVTHPWQSSSWEVLLFLGGISLPWSPDLSTPPPLLVPVPLLETAGRRPGKPNSPNSAARTVNFRSFYLSNPPLTLCSYRRQVSPGCPQLSSLLASDCHHLVLSNECRKRFSFAFFG